MRGNIYLLPITLGDSKIDYVIPKEVQKIIGDLQFMIVENIRTTRRYLSKLGFSDKIDSITFFSLNKHTKQEELDSFLSPIEKGENIGIMSEAGTPGVADPGADVVFLAHQKGIKVIPLVGPSSILMAIMAAGFNGQNFAFNGYLPIKKPERIKKIRQLEHLSFQEKQSQLFIEAPYRNKALFDDILEACSDSTWLCIASNISLPNEYIQTKTIKEWKKSTPNIQKQPAIFIIQKY